MESERSPVKKVGQHNYQCPNYDVCVADVTEKEWPFWTCSECENKLSGTGVSLVSCSPQAQTSSADVISM
jgi:hypothetical protein